MLKQINSNITSFIRFNNTWVNQPWLFPIFQISKLRFNVHPINYKLYLCLTPSYSIYIVRGYNINLPYLVEYVIITYISWLCKTTSLNKFFVLKRFLLAFPGSFNLKSFEYFKDHLVFQFNPILPHISKSIVLFLSDNLLLADINPFPASTSSSCKI